ncbi:MULTISPECIES: hypothetical protein [unclassified Pseudomonas]|uniref:hypothetical protein n=1 Tax=unclassified Pseudomonas TaxID=196821 RepID=UPI001F56AA4C|nr:MULTISPECIES: hypothetical protein [unclassified Pseudomonas]
MPLMRVGRRCAEQAADRNAMIIERGEQIGSGHVLDDKQLNPGSRSVAYYHPALRQAAQVAAHA